MITINCSILLNYLSFFLIVECYWSSRLLAFEIVVTVVEYNEFAQFLGARNVLQLCSTKFLDNGHYLYKRGETVFFELLHLAAIFVQCIGKAGSGSLIWLLEHNLALNRKRSTQIVFVSTMVNCNAMNFYLFSFLFLFVWTKG